MGDSSELRDNTEEIYKILNEVYVALKEKGYDPISQFKGYIISGDLGYVSNYKKSRNKIGKLDRGELIEVLLKSYLK